MITGLAHTGVCVPDCEAAVAYYRDVLGFTVLSPPYVMDGDAIRADMGELLADPAMKAAIVGFGDDGDRVLEVIEYLRADGSDARRAAGLADSGLTHVGLICDNLDETRKSLENKGVRFLVDGVADIAGVRTTWFADPWGSSSSSSRRASPSVRTSHSLASPRLALIRLPFTVGQWLSAVCSSTSTAFW
jgi:catechol 2,3-dioxygenase-like lactoylglutathione lyase family enzyme